MKLAIVTHTNYKRPEWMEIATNSITSILPSTAEHVIIECKNRVEFLQGRWDALSLAEYIAFVDDDDIVINNSINKCLSALENSQAGIAFTEEQRIDSAGNIIPACSPIRQHVRYANLAVAPNAAHHLVMIRTSAVPRELITFADVEEKVMGLEWLMKSAPALLYGAVRIPEYGYQWRQHPAGIHHDRDWIERYTASVPHNRELLRRYASVDIEDIVPEFRLIG